MKTVFIFLAAIGGLLAQTGVTPSQVRTAAATPAYRLFAFDAAGRATLVTLGAGLEISNGVITSKPAAVSATVSLSTVPLSRAADGTYPAQSGAVVYTRNGLLILEGVDYTLAAGRLTPVGAWATDDQVVARRVDVTVQ